LKQKIQQESKNEAKPKDRLELVIKGYSYKRFILDFQTHIEPITRGKDHP